MTRLYGRSPRGERLVCPVPAGRWETTTLIAAVGKSGPKAPCLFDGPLDGEAFAAYVEQLLAKVLGPGDILVMDNLSSHKNSAALRILEEAGVRVLFLPPYSPDLNPIEKMWSKIKASLRKTAARTAEALTAAVAQALAAVTQEDICGWFQSCGYKI